MLQVQAGLPTQDPGANQRWYLGSSAEAQMPQDQFTFFGLGLPEPRWGGGSVSKSTGTVGRALASPPGTVWIPSWGWQVACTWCGSCQGEGSQKLGALPAWAWTPFPQPCACTSPARGPAPAPTGPYEPDSHSTWSPATILLTDLWGFEQCRLNASGPRALQCAQAAALQGWTGPVHAEGRSQAMGQAERGPGWTSALSLG